MDPDSLLQAHTRFGVDLGLDRIQRLLARLQNPHHHQPFVHVAGTNGKGSVCAYLSAVLRQAGYQVGRYTSPHLVDWCERICLNDHPIPWATLQTLLVQIQAVTQNWSLDEKPTQFEVLTAAAWSYFAQEQVDIVVMEVGLGGRLDATNVGDRPLVSVITSIAWDHWQHLGPTLKDIAREKAGIFKPHRPAVIGPLPSEAIAVMAERTRIFNCPTTWVQPAQPLTNGEAQYGTLRYSLPLLGPVQLANSAVAIATLQELKSQGWWRINDEVIITGLSQATWPGRLQWYTWKSCRLLLDGAHNEAGAQALRQFLDQGLQGAPAGQAVTWIMGMLATKDHQGIFQALLRPGDRLHLVPVPDHQSANPEELASLAFTICPPLAVCQAHDNLQRGLEAACGSSESKPKPWPVLCGSLYLIGYFLKIVRSC